MRELGQDPSTNPRPKVLAPIPLDVDLRPEAVRSACLGSPFALQTEIGREDRAESLTGPAFALLRAPRRRASQPCAVRNGQLSSQTATALQDTTTEARALVRIDRRASGRDENLVLAAEAVIASNANVDAERHRLRFRVNPSARVNASRAAPRCCIVAGPVTSFRLPLLTPHDEKRKP